MSAPDHTPRSIPSGSAASLRAATARDRFLIHRWLADPDISRWWGSKASAEAEIALALESPSALCRMIEVDGQPAGYAHAIDIGLWRTKLPAELPAGAWKIELFIGSPAHRGMGLGPAALALIATEVFSTTLAVACCVFAPVRNEPAVRTYERAGFRWLCIWEDPASGPCWVLIKDRTG